MKKEAEKINKILISTKKNLNAEMQEKISLHVVIKNLQYKLQSYGSILLQNQAILNENETLQKEINSLKTNLSEIKSSMENITKHKDDRLSLYKKLFKEKSKDVERFKSEVYLFFKIPINLVILYIIMYII